MPKPLKWWSRQQGTHRKATATFRFHNRTTLKGYVRNITGPTQKLGGDWSSSLNCNELRWKAALCSLCHIFT